MQIVYYPENNEYSFKPSVIALGFFDGVHKAHRKILSEAKKLADSMELELSVFTFPSESESIKSKSPRIYSTEQKLSLLEECGADTVILCDFSSVCGLSADGFSTLLRERFMCRGAVCGFNFRFGKDALGDAQLLKSSLALHGIPTVAVGEVVYRGVSLSSTYIRELLTHGRIDEANDALGKPYFTEGTVERGIGIGHGIGIPTVNTPLTPSLSLLPRGVYETLCLAEGKLFPALTNIGSCPTFGERPPHVETYLLDFNGNLYGKQVRLYFLSFIREEIGFPDSESLIKQIELDKKRVREGQRSKKWLMTGLK